MGMGGNGNRNRPSRTPLLGRRCADVDIIVKRGFHPTQRTQRNGRTATDVTDATQRLLRTFLAFIAFMASVTYFIALGCVRCVRCVRWKPRFKRATLGATDGDVAVQAAFAYQPRWALRTGWLKITDTDMKMTDHDHRTWNCRTRNYRNGRLNTLSRFSIAPL